MRILCSPTVRKSPLKSICFSSENQDHCQIPGSRFFIVHGREAREWRDKRDAPEQSLSFYTCSHFAPFALFPPVALSQRAATASFTVFVTFARMLASFGKSMMSSSENVMNFRFGPFVREIRNMLLEGVTGITTCTAPSTPFTTSKNFCLPSSISSIHSTFLFHQAAILFAAVVGLSPIARIDRSPSEVRG